ncbi:cytochrome P450 [Brevundimonas sp.]|uniref:cytochrome P450 n=1 Tax=Brevundimonas sp. TaxID=1871086 RepID=UPI002898B417|nr:cytochrome P450 [Brevundimonas sp.]
MSDMARTATSAGFRPWVPTRRSHKMGLVPFLWQSWRDPLQLWGELHFQELYVAGTSPLGRTLVVSDPVGVRRVLTDNALNYEKGDLQRRVLGPMLADGLLLTEGEQWRRARRIMAPLFTPAYTAKTAEVMDTVCRRRLEGWKLDQGARILNIDHEMSGLTFDILSATMFSDDLDGDAAGFEKALNQFLEVGARISPLDALKAPDWIPRLGKLASRGSAHFFQERVSALVKRRRARIETGDAPDDLLTALLSARDEEGDGSGLSDHEVMSNILTFILAGHETTARTLGWTLHLITRDTAVAQNLKEEADGWDRSSGGIKTMVWHKAVIEEAMRLFPPAPAMIRQAVADDVIEGHEVKAGDSIVIAPWLIQRHEKLWDEPDVFKPERFLPENRKNIDRYAWLPFSGGPRICIGAAFAMQEAIIALAEILKVAEVEAITPVQPRPIQQITLRSRETMRLRLRARRVEKAKPSDRG